MTEKPLKPLSRPRTATSEISSPLTGNTTIPQPFIVKFPGKQTLTFSDGLNFGCGFFVAGLLFSLAMIPISFLLFSLLIGMVGGLAGLGR